MVIELLPLILKSVHARFLQGGCCSSTARPAPNLNEIDLSHFEMLKARSPSSDSADKLRGFLQVVGKGGFGKVNAVQRIGTKELYALKRMDKHTVIQKQVCLRSVSRAERWHCAVAHRNGVDGAAHHVPTALAFPLLSGARSDAIAQLNAWFLQIYSFQSPTELFFVMPFMQGEREACTRSE